MGWKLEGMVSDAAKGFVGPHEDVVVETDGLSQVNRIGQERATVLFQRYGRSKRIVVSIFEERREETRR